MILIFGSMNKMYFAFDLIFHTVYPGITVQPISNVFMDGKQLQANEEHILNQSHHL